MKHALLPLILALMMIGAVGRSAEGSLEGQAGSSATSASNAGVIYARRCASCHGTDGKSDTPKGKLRSARDLTDRQWQSDVSDERIFNSIMNGRGHMPGFGKRLSEADINSLVIYVRGLKK